MTPPAQLGSRARPLNLDAGGHGSQMRPWPDPTAILSAMTKLLSGLLVLVGGAFGVAAPAQADCCETEFDWAAPYADALRARGLGNIISELGIQSGLAAEDVRKGASAYGIADKYNLDLATAEQIAGAAYDVCPDRAR